MAVIAFIQGPLLLMYVVEILIKEQIVFTKLLKQQGKNITQSIYYVLKSIFFY
jgi:hypothetical protein